MRFITIEQYNGAITAHLETDNYADELDSAACWVWQNADNKTQAIKQHHDRHAAWESDINAGNEPKETY